MALLLLKMHISFSADLSWCSLVLFSVNPNTHNFFSCGLVGSGYRHINQRLEMFKSQNEKFSSLKFIIFFISWPQLKTFFFFKEADQFTHFLPIRLKVSLNHAAKTLFSAVNNKQGRQKVKIKMRIQWK